MRILYLSDNYGKHNEGTKPSIFHSALRHGHSVGWKTVHSKGPGKIDGKSLLASVETGKFDWVWVAHSWAALEGCTKADINAAGAKVLGFGFSDPYAWNASKLANYDAYVTNHFGTLDKLKGGDLPVASIITAGDTRFHKRLGGVPRDIDVLIVGLGLHPRFTPRDYRLQMVKDLRKRLPDLKIEVFGTKWGDVANHGQILGPQFLQTLNRARVSLDLQQPHAPLAHRMFECMMCGTPVITRKRSETDRLFGDWDGISYYNELDDLVEQIQAALVKKTWEERSQRVEKYVLENHDIENRMDPLFKWLKEMR